MSVEEQMWAVEGDSWSPSWADSADEELVREYGIASGGGRASQCRTPIDR